MTIQRRAGVMAVLIAVASILYLTARSYSPSLIQYVVEQTLIQKAPQGADPVGIRTHFHALMSSAPNRDDQIRQLIQISEYLERVQTLTPQELDELMRTKMFERSPR
jgi:hypothetical protein